MHHCPNDLFRSRHARTDRSIDRGRVQNGKGIFTLFSTVESPGTEAHTHSLQEDAWLDLTCAGVTVARSDFSESIASGRFNLLHQLCTVGSYNIEITIILSHPCHRWTHIVKCFLPKLFCSTSTKMQTERRTTLSKQ